MTYISEKDVAEKVMLIVQLVIAERDKLLADNIRKDEIIFKLNEHIRCLNLTLEHSGIGYKA